MIKLIQISWNGNHVASSVLIIVNQGDGLARTVEVIAANVSDVSIKPRPLN